MYMHAYLISTCRLKCAGTLGMWWLVLITPDKNNNHLLGLVCYIKMEICVHVSIAKLRLKIED